MAPTAPSAGAPTPTAASARSFSTTVHMANANVRVCLPGMEQPKLFNNIPINQYTRLPNHRPPLRRDKPVRISLPGHRVRYLYPTTERSFIFIPRALRPNQQAYRGRNRLGSLGGFSSRRTSAYGGSRYSPSIAMSRRSSMTREMGRDAVVSPDGSIMSQHTLSSAVDPVRPVVRLPPGGANPAGLPHVLPAQDGPPVHAVPQLYPPPQRPAFRENWAQGQLPMYQPRPQKTVSLTGIESPVSVTFQPPLQPELQPFHQQMPAHMASALEYVPHYPPHIRHLSHPSQASTGTPLSNIPERAIHAPVFQPFQQPAYPHGMPMPPNNGYYPAPHGMPPQFIPPGDGMVPMFVPPPAAQPGGGYMVPIAAPSIAAPSMAAPPTAPPPPAPLGSDTSEVQPPHAQPQAQAQPRAQPQPQPQQQPQQQQQQMGEIFPYESNGMTYYLDASQYYNTTAATSAAPAMDGYPPQLPAGASYAVPGIGGMMTPSPEGYFYPPVPPPGAMYYTPQ